MEIEKLYIYPIKSMRGVSVPKATLTTHGFPYDRSFMILKEGEDPRVPVTIADTNVTTRYWQEIDFVSETLSVTFRPAGNGDVVSTNIPLVPDTSSLEVIDVVMHKSPTKAYKMPAEHNDFFSSCFGFKCILAYIGDYKREVRMSALGWQPAFKSNQTNGWLSLITSVASQATNVLLGQPENQPSKIRFADVAPYLVASSKSLEDVQGRLPEGDEQYDIVKFRPNIVVKGASAVWEEDFWAQLTIGGHTQLECEHNCGRCRSINIDYETGAQGKGEAGSMLKKLSKDRRVDVGSKWSPIFGRYAFLKPEFDGDEIKVGDEVVVSRRNKEHTAMDWAGLSTLPGGGRG